MRNQVKDWLKEIRASLPATFFVDFVFRTVNSAYNYVNSPSQGLSHESKSDISLKEKTLRELLNESQYRDGPYDQSTAEALSNLAGYLTSYGSKSEAVSVLDDYIERFSESGDLFIRERLAAALFDRGAIYQELYDKQRALESYRKLIQLFARSPEECFLIWIARARVNMGYVHYEQQNYELALATFENVIDLYSSTNNSQLSEQIIKTRIGKMESLIALGRMPEARKIGVALIGEVSRLNATGQGKIAVSLCELFVVSFERNRDPQLREMADTARVLRNTIQPH